MLVFNPYSIFGPLGVYASLIFVLLSLSSGTYKFESKANLLPFIIIVIVGSWGWLISVINNIDQFDQLKAVVTFIFIWFSAQGVFYYAQKIGLNFRGFLFYLSLIIVANNLVILLELQLPFLRDIIEHFLVDAGNIDWREGFRYRGLASSGGASLSLTLPVVILITLFNHEYTSKLFVLFAIAISIMSTLVTGRTGLLLTPLVIFMYLFYAIIIEKNNNIAEPILLIFLLAMVLSIFSDFVIEYLSSMFGEGFLRYSFGFILEGRSGLEEEGTVSMIIGFLKVLPLSFPEFFTGYGFYGGSNFDPWTDSGFSRMFLSVGFPLGLIFYYSICLLYFKNINKEFKFLIYSIAIVLMIGELKEIMFFSKYSARIFILIVVCSRLYAFYSSANISTYGYKGGKL